MAPNKHRQRPRCHQPLGPVRRLGHSYVRNADKAFIKGINVMNDTASGRSRRAILNKYSS